MERRRIACLKLDRIAPEVDEALWCAGWDIDYASDLRAFDKLLRSKPALLCMLLLGRADQGLCGELAAFSRSYAEAEWIGVFHPEALPRRQWREFILGQLFDFHTLPIDLPRLILSLGHAYGHARLRLELRERHALDAELGMIGHSATMQSLFKQLRRIADSEATVLIGGENGSGKELTALAIHRCSRRRGAPFVPVSCGAIPASLIQAELFGHLRGAFTGALGARQGLIESANKGTLFLDEIADLPLELQTNLLRFLQEKTITRIGASSCTPVDVRVVSATNVDLQGAVAQGRFRQDLYYRLNVVPLVVPPLRERREDIVALATHFLRRHAAEGRKRLHGFTGDARTAMLAHPWPGNVRELINRVQRAVVSADGHLVCAADLGLRTPARRQAEDLALARTSAERAAIADSLARAGSNKTRAAQHLGVSRMTLYRLMDKHGLRGDADVYPG